MSDLKTLKDLEKYCYERGMIGIPSLLLKEEAVKWIKNLEKKDLGSGINKIISDWIIHFFNITEEDWNDR